MASIEYMALKARCAIAPGARQAAALTLHILVKRAKEMREREFEVSRCTLCSIKRECGRTSEADPIAGNEV